MNTPKTLWCQFNIEPGKSCRRAAGHALTLDGGMLVMLACREHLRRMERAGRVSSQEALTPELKAKYFAEM